MTILNDRQYAQEPPMTLKNFYGIQEFLVLVSILSMALAKHGLNEGVMMENTR